MKNPMGNNFKPTANRTERAKLPVGVYVAKLMAAKEENSNLILQLDICEGEYTDFFRRDFEAQKGGNYEARYRGTYRMQFPDGKDGRIDDIRNRQINGAAWAVEQSNPGYKWSWDTLERDIKGKLVGINVRERDYVMEDRMTHELVQGVTTEIGALEDVNAVRAGKVRPMRKRELSARDKARLQESAPAAESALTPVQVSEDEIPF